MSAIINGDSPSITFSDATTQATSAVVSGKVPYSILPTGSVLQVVTGTTTTSTSTTSASAVTTTLTASITPKSSTNKILVLFTMGGAASNAGSSGMNLSLFRAGSNIADVGDNIMYNNASTLNINSASGQYLDSPATTSSTSYAIYFLSGQGSSVTVQRGSTPSYITLLEIAA